jgi:hypothetical protein
LEAAISYLHLGWIERRGGSSIRLKSTLSDEDPQRNDLVSKGEKHETQRRRDGDIEWEKTQRDWNANFKCLEEGRWRSQAAPEDRRARTKKAFLQTPIPPKKGSFSLVGPPCVSLIVLL